MKYFLAFIVTVLIVGGCIAFVVKAVIIHNEYESKIGAYIENAYEVNTPERMIEQIELSKKAMEKTLSPEDYGVIWFKRPDNIMSWQYDFLDSVVERANSVVEWREKIEKSNEVENLGDVYETKMDNLREFLKENGRADWIAKNAWYIENHFVFYFGELIILLWAIGGAGIIIFSWVIAKDY